MDIIEIVICNLAWNMCVVRQTTILGTTRNTKSLVMKRLELKDEAIT